MLHRIRSANAQLLLGGAIVALIVALIALGPVLQGDQAGEGDLGARLLAPGAEGHLLGTDPLGRDVLSRVVAGFRWSATVGAIATLVAAATGTVVGLLAGYREGWLRVVLTRSIDIAIAFPYLVLAVSIIAVLGRGVAQLGLILGFVSWPLFARVVYAETLSIREREYVRAAYLTGVSSRVVLFRHVIPAMQHTLVTLAAFTMAQMIVAEGGLSLLGLGAPLGEPSWGNMLAESRQYMTTAPWLLIAPAAAIVLCVLGLNLLGDGLDEASEGAR